MGYAIDTAPEHRERPEVPPWGEHCDLCRRACPSGALQGPWAFSPLRCVSCWTTFGNRNPPRGMTGEMPGEWICGWDACQDTCPFNRTHDWSAGEHPADLEAVAPLLVPENLPNLSDAFLVEQIIAGSAGHLHGGRRGGPGGTPSMVSPQPAGDEGAESGGLTDRLGFSVPRPRSGYCPGGSGGDGGR